MNTWKLISIALVAVGLAPLATAQVITYDIQPQTYESPGGLYSLRVVPSDRHGAGPAEYTLRRIDGKVVWSATKEFTLIGATVTDQGRVAGYGYLKGPSGMGPSRKPLTTQAERKEARDRFDNLMKRVKLARSGESRAESSPAESSPAEPNGAEAGEAESKPQISAPSATFGAMVEDKAFIVYLSETGNTRICHTIPREGMVSCMSSPSIAVSDVSLEPENDVMTALVRKEEGGRERHNSLLAFRTSTGEILLDAAIDSQLNGDQTVFIAFAARAIRGTPLTLVSWAGEDGNGSRWKNACFNVLDGSGRSIWHFNLPGDYEDADDKKEDAIWDEARTGGSILRSANPWEFKIRSFEDGKSISFGVEEEPIGQWKIRELRREPYAAAIPTKRKAKGAAPKPPLPPLAERAARPAGVLDLAAGASEQGDIHDCDGLLATGDGAITFMRRDQASKELRLVVVDPKTKETRSFAPQIEPYMRSGIAPFSKDRWLILGNRDGVTDETKGLDAYWLDPKSGACEKAAETDVTFPKGVGILGERSFVVLGSTRHQTTTSEPMTAYAGAMPSWSVGASRGLGMEQAMCVTSRGEIAVLGSSRVDFFSASGELARSVDLAESWGRQPSYPSEVSPDMDGGVIVCDFGGMPSIVRMRADGSKLSEFTPVFKDGKTIRNHVVVTPVGQLWTTDGHCLCRLDASGTVVEILGNRPSNDIITGVAAMALDGARNVYLLDSRTGAVHVFDEKGARPRVCKPAPNDIKNSCGSVSAHLAVAPSGDVYVEAAERDFMNTGNYVHFGANGERLGVDDFSVGDIYAKIEFQPTSGNRWIVGYKEVFLTDRDGNILRTIDRGGDGRFFATIGPSAVAPDGSLAFLPQGGIELFTGVADPEPAEIQRVDAGGKLLPSVALPTNIQMYVKFAFDGKRLAFLAPTSPTSSAIAIVSVADGSGFKFPIPNSNDPPLGVLLPAGLDEVWVYSGKPTIQRYSIGGK
jgi:hypothetical protein